MGRGSTLYVIFGGTFQVPEYCRTFDESEIRENAFNLIFAFDEIVALGYRENVNLAQIRTFVEMDSHEEKVYQAVRQVYVLHVLTITNLIFIVFSLINRPKNAMQR